MNLPLDEDDSVLISGPTLSGRRRLFHRVLADLASTPVVISTRQTADGMRNSHERIVAAAAGKSAASTSSSTGPPLAEPVVVDCVTNALDDSKVDTPMTKHAQHPSNLTSIGTKFTEVVDEWGAEDCAVGIETISPLLVYAEPSTVFRFLNLVVQQARGTEWPVVATIDSGAHDDIDVKRFVPIFEQVLETRRSDDDHQQFRVRGPGSSSFQVI